MLYNGQYFRKGTKRALDELKQLRLPFDLEAGILAVIQAETVEKIRERLMEVFILTDGYLQVPKKKELASAENLRGTYEEMYSNWKNKMAEAAGRDDVYSSFMNLLSLQWMFYEIAECIAVDDLKEQALESKQEFFDNGEFVINGSELLDKMDDYREWCRSIDANTKEETVHPDWVITDTFFAVAGNDRIVGIIDLRHTLNDFLKDLGNCGYSVRPSERRKGYAAAIIRCCETGRDERTASFRGKEE